MLCERTASSGEWTGVCLKEILQDCLKSEPGVCRDRARAGVVVEADGDSSCASGTGQTVKE